ncbi:MAG: sulfatase [Bryobacterales bacterium]|nr:sulfatase [Bryobacterales bacterium]
MSGLRRALVPCLLTACLLAAPMLADQPNILFLMSDDHAAHALGAYGGRLKVLDPTPALDRLAGEGMLFENAFCTNSICTPSRATLLTGQFSHVNGVTTLSGHLEGDRQYVANLVRDAGYQTAMVGKWHLKRQPAFDYYCVLPGQGSYFNPVMRESGGRWPDHVRRFSAYDSVHSTDAIVKASIDWLKQRDRERPFFLMTHFKAPHDNFENAERYDFLYDDIAIPEPESLWRVPNHGSEATRGAGTSVGRRNTRRNMGHHMFVDPGLAAEAYKRTAYQRYLKKYLRTVRGVDDGVAQLLEHLRRDGELDNTVVIYTSDQGFMLGEHDYIDKRWMYEESMRIPLLVRHPELVGAGSRSEAIVNNTDFAPTLLALAGIKAPPFMQGRSLVPLLEGEVPDDWRTSTYYRYWMNYAHHDVPAHFGVRTRDFKLIFFYGLPLDAPGAKTADTQPGWELYDLRVDPGESRNVYGDAAYADVANELKTELRRLKDETGDTDEKFPELMEVLRKHW